MSDMFLFLCYFKKYIFIIIIRYFYNQKQYMNIFRLRKFVDILRENVGFGYLDLNFRILEVRLVLEIQILELSLYKYKIIGLRDDLVVLV